MKVLISSSLALSVAAVASATSVNLTFDGFGAGVVMKLSYAANQSYSAANRNSGTNIQAREHIFTNTANGRTVANYCVQVFESVSPGNSYDYDVVNVNDVPDFPPGPGPMGAVRGALMRNLYARFYGQVEDGLDNVKAAAFAMLVWEISHENFNAVGAGASAADILNAGAIDVALGAFQASNVAGLSGNQLAAFNQAQAWIATMVANSGNLRSRGIYGLTNPTAQDHIGVVVPVPAPALLAGLGLVGVLSGRRRSR
jgi:hypothetical protein